MSALTAITPTALTIDLPAAPPAVEPMCAGDNCGRDATFELWFGETSIPHGGTGSVRRYCVPACGRCARGARPGLTKTETPPDGTKRTWRLIDVHPARPTI